VVVLPPRPCLGIMDPIRMRERCDDWLLMVVKAVINEKHYWWTGGRMSLYLE